MIVTDRKPARRRVTSVLLAVAAVVVALLIAPGVASAAPDKPTPPDAGTAAVFADQVAAPCGNPEPFGALCYFYRSNYGGAQAGFVPDVVDLLSPTRWLFRSGDGGGQQVANNAGSAHNRDTSCNVTIYYHRNFNAENPSAPKITLTRGTSHPTLAGVNNNNRSHDFHTCV
jgi:hypothetical protein